MIRASHRVSCWQHGQAAVAVLASSSASAYPKAASKASTARSAWSATAPSAFCLLRRPADRPGQPLLQRAHDRGTPIRLHPQPAGSAATP